MKRTAIGVLVGAFLAAPVVHAAEADRYPSRPVRIITEESLLKLGAIPSPTTPPEFRAYLESELKKWTPIIQAAGIKAD